MFLPISDAFELYRLDYILFKNQSKRAEESNLTCQRSLIAYCGDIPIDKLDFTTIRNWKLYLDKGREPSSVRNYILTLRVVLRFLKSRGYKVVDAESIPIPTRVKRAPVYATAEEVSLLIDNCFDIRGQAIVSLLFSSGIRLSELLSMNRGMIRNKRFTIVGKGGRPRLCFTDSRTIKLLNLYLSTRSDNDPALFVSRQGHTRMTHTNVQLIVRGAAQRAGITKHITPHKLRHGYATNFLENDGNMRYLKEMLGHQSLETTAQYAHVVDNNLQRIYEKHHTI